MKIINIFSALFNKSESHIEHIGTPHQGPIPHSGRYEYGSGNNPNQHPHDILANANKLKKDGLTELEISKSLNISTTELRALKSVSKNEKLREQDALIIKLKEKGYGTTAIAHEIFDEEMIAKYGVEEGLKKAASKESYIRSRLAPVVRERQKNTDMVYNALKENVDNLNIVDIGPGSEAYLGVSRSKLLGITRRLEEEGYQRDVVYVKQIGTGSQKKTQIQYLAKPGTTKQEAYQYLNRNEIALLGGVKDSAGDRTSLGIQPPTAVDLSRVYVRYNEEGGAKLDGTIELRKNVEDLSLGNASYAQVRIKVTDGTNEGYMKGIALYKDDIPEGYDIVYNSNRHVDAPLFKAKGETRDTVFKGMKSDPDNPFGTTLRMENGQIVGQHMYLNSKTGEEELSPINIVRETGDWNNWSRTLAAQFLSKQPLSVITPQLEKTFKGKEEEYEELMSLTNPIVKQKLLYSFADDCESSAVHLKAAAMPRQATKLLLPYNSVKDGEIYAPSFKDGEEVILIRYPHGGLFEIPRLTVNNHNPECEKTLGNAIDAVGININTAGILSGADFDGDTVVVIPTAGTKLQNKKPLSGLANFEPKEIYKIPDYLSPEERDKLTMKDTQMEMGKITNLITDMTIQGADEKELERAVKHSMVVIDAEKHGLDYKRSYRDNGIKELQDNYQKRDNGRSGGSTTIISRAKSPQYVQSRKEAYSTNQLYKEPSEETQKIYYEDKKELFVKDGTWHYKEGKDAVDTGEIAVIDQAKVDDFNNGKKVYITTYKLTNTPKEPSDLEKQYGKKNLYAIKGTWNYKDENGDLVDTGRKVEYNKTPSRTKSTKMREAEDAMDLVSSPDSLKEIEYAKFANNLKELGAMARKEAMSIETYEVSKDAQKTYAKEIESLNNKILLAEMNKPLERKAESIADVIYKSKLDDNPAMDSDEKKKIQTQAMTEARARVGASKIDSAVKITDEEWEAIQAHAVSATTLRKIMTNTDEDRLKQLATPRESTKISDAQILRIKSLNDSISISEIADKVGMSTKQVSKYLDGITPTQMNMMRNYEASGMTIEQIASALGVSPSTVSKYLN